MQPRTVQGQVHACLERAPGWLSQRQVADGAAVSVVSARKYLAALEQAGQLDVIGEPRSRMYRLRRAETAMVSRADLDILLAHYYDEVLGTPDRSHWRLPLLRAACDRLAAATRPAGADVHPVLRREET
jgi:hypothetical protein